MDKKTIIAYIRRRPELAAYKDEQLLDYRELTFSAPSEDDKRIIRYSQKSEIQSVTFGIIASLLFIAFLVMNMFTQAEYGIHPTAYFTLTVLLILLVILIFHFSRLQKGAAGVIRAKLVCKTTNFFIKKPGLDPLRDGGQKAVLWIEDQKVLLYPASFNRSDFTKLAENSTVILAKLHTNTYKVFPL